MVRRVKRSPSSSPPFPPPLLGTDRRPDLRPATFGDEVARWHLLLNRQHMMPHQRYVHDVAGELDPMTGLRWYELVIESVPRQSGKTQGVEAQMAAASRRPDPLAQLVRRTVLYLAQDRLMARERLVVELGEQKMDRNPALRGMYRLRRSNGSESITWRDTGGRMMAQASTDTAAHGLTVDDVYLDEAFSHADLTIVNGVEPTMITRPDPQLWVTSTRGDGTDGLLLHYEEIAAAALNDPDTKVCVFLWGAGEDDDRADPAVWRRVMPALGYTQTEERVRRLLSTTPPAEFDRAYLNRRPTAGLLAAIDPEAWADCANDGPTLAPAGPLVLAVDVDTERTHGVVAIAWAHPRGVAVIVRRSPGTTWMVDTAMEIVHRQGLTVFDVWGDRRAGIGGVLDQLAGRGVPTHEVSAGDVASACGDLFDLTKARMVVHDDQAELTGAVPGSRRRPLGEAWAFSKLDSLSDVAALNAAGLAIAGYRHHFPVGAPTGGIS